MKAFFIFICAVLAVAQTTSMIGAIVRVDPSTRTLVVKPDAGAEVTLSLDPSAAFRRVSPGDTNLQNAAAIGLADIAPGDRVLARGTSPGAANLIVVMSQSDVSKKQAADRADWEKRGVAGLAASVAADSIALNSRAINGNSRIIVAVVPNTTIRRYAPDSIRFADARPAKLADIRPGDQVRARGERSGDRMIAEEVVAGTFRTFPAQVAAISGSELQVTDLAQKKRLTIRIVADTALHKLDARAAQAIAQRLRQENAGKSSDQPDLAQTVERSPAFAISTLRVGDALVVTSSEGSDRVTAVSLVAGVEPILNRPGANEMSLGDWDLQVLGGGPP
jgi:hypothetical protein